MSALNTATDGIVDIVYDYALLRSRLKASIVHPLVEGL